MRIASLLSLVFLVGSLACAAEIPLDDTTVILNERVGPIEKGMSLTNLKALFGGSKVKSAQLPGAEGETIDGAKLFGGTDKELEIIFNQEGDEKMISDIRIIGKGWKFKNGLKLGLTATEIEKINGKPYKIAGFGWDYGGYANFEGGKLADGVSIRFDTNEAEVPDSLSGDRQISTTDKKLRALNPKVAQISVYFRS